MELTIDQALQQAIEAHKTGRLQDAERLYRAIIQVQPLNADANHNLGVLVFGLGKLHDAIPYLKAALQSNPRQGQFWISYISVLLEAKQVSEACRILEEGKRIGLTGNSITQLEKKLYEQSQDKTLTQIPKPRYEKKAENSRAKKLKTGRSPTITPGAPSQQKISQLLASYNTGNFDLAQKQAKAFTETYPNHPLGWNLLGSILRSIQKLDDSLESMRMSLKLAPRDPTAHYNLGVTLQDLGRPEEAAASYREAIALKPNLARAHYNLGNTLRDLMRFEEAKASYRQAAALSPSFVDAHYNLGITLQDLGRLEEAETSYQETIRLNPNHLQSRLALGNLLQDLGRSEEAEASYRQAIALKPDFAEAHSNLGNALRDLERPEEAAASYREAIALKPNLAQAHYNLGNTLRDLRRFEEAKASYRQAAALSPSFVDAHYNLGVLLQDLGQLEEAEARYRQAIALKPDFAEAHNNLGNALRDLRRLEEAEACYRQAIALKPNFTEAYNNLGNALQDLERLEEAEASYRQAIALKPDFAEAHNNLGNALQDLGRLDEAEASYRQAIALKPDFAEAHSNLGNALRDLGRLEEAALSHRKAVALKPDFSEAHFNLGVTLQELGELEEAEENLRQALAIRSNSSSHNRNPSITALLPFGRAGSLFLHSLLDGHPQIITLPGVYFKGWFGINRWRKFSPDITKPMWREQIVSMIMEVYQPLFDPNCKHNVPGKPFGRSNWLAKDQGFTEMGADRSKPLILNQDAFSETLLDLLRPYESIDIRSCFELIHYAFEIGVRKNIAIDGPADNQIFYHIHNPDLFERGHFLKHYPQARLLHLIRDPVQSLESWVRVDYHQIIETNIEGRLIEAYQLYCWRKIVAKIVAMFQSMRFPDNILPGSRGVRLEDVKRNTKNTMPQLAAWMGISDHPALYESSFCGLQYWGPTSKTIGAITGFDTKAIDQPVGDFFGDNDIKIFETLFFPLSSLYGYQDRDEEGFRHRLIQIRPWLDQPMQFEKALYERLPNQSRKLEEFPHFKRLHRLLYHFWSVLDREGTYQNMVSPLRLDL